MRRQDTELAWKRLIWVMTSTDHLGNLVVKYCCPAKLSALFALPMVNIVTQMNVFQMKIFRQPIPYRTWSRD